MVHFDCLYFRLTLVWLYGLCCFFLPDAYVAKWHVMFVCCLFLPDAYVAKWHVMFVCCMSRLTPLRPHGLSCFDSCLMPPRLHDLFIICLPDAPVGYMAYVVLSSVRLTPLLAIGLVLFCHLFA